ncbi:hypothetical protein QSH39_021085 [Xanthomonas arboricola pv. corylina]|nr:hypothetical protein [Xanthomonas arboricola]MDN0205335.1 hypothetical protein [Xanthomonas arboricola pv. corylina]MDN0215381.1 hypothetical protein [Xanthomonas arboricola pv. corylina]
MNPDVRFVYADGAYNWRHKLEIPASAIDLTDLDDEALEAFVRAQVAA